MGVMPVPFLQRGERMRTFQEIIAQVDAMVPNVFPEARKLQWLTTLDGRIAADVFLMDIAQIRELPHGFPGAMDAEPLVGYPHDDLYDFWLEAKIHATNGEYDKYQNIMELYNESYSSFTRWFCSVYQPAQGGRGDRFVCRSDLPTYFITAYGLAVKQGYRGSVDEWLASLKGEKGDTGKSAYQYALEAGYAGTEEAFRESQLNNGKTAYEYAVDGGYTGTVAEFTLKLAAEYAAKDHNHDEDYAEKDHNHDKDYAEKNHNHDEDYAEKGHDHEGAYLEVEDGAVTKPLILKENVHFGTALPEDPVVGQVYFLDADYADLLEV